MYCMLYIFKNKSVKSGRNYVALNGKFFLTFLILFTQHFIYFPHKKYCQKEGAGNGINDFSRKNTPLPRIQQRMVRIQIPNSASPRLKPLQEIPVFYFFTNRLNRSGEKCCGKSHDPRDDLQRAELKIVTK